MRRLLVSALWLSGCAEWLPAPPRSVGLPSEGWLVGGVSLPDRGPGFARARPGESTRFGVARLVHGIETAAAAVVAAHPASVPLRVGDLGAPGGGEHRRHHSHRSGRDVDLVFFQTDASGTSVPSVPAAFDRTGRTVVDGREVRFDVARNWTLVRTLVRDDSLGVQWIFCADGIRAQLLAHAADHETDPEVLVRAVGILHQPTDGRPHDDHFHVRVACTAEERLLGCRDRPPYWPWIGATETLAPPEDDASLLAALRDEAP